MIRKLFGLIFICIVIAGAALFFVSKKGLTIPLTETFLNRQLEQQFPIEESYMLIFHLELDNPKVHLDSGTDKLGLMLDAFFRIGTKGADPYKGNIDVESDLRFDQNEGKLYLVNPEVRKFAVDGIKEKDTKKAILAVNMALSDLLNDFPIYTLDETDRAQKTAKMLLKDIKIENGRLKIVFGL